MGHFPVRYVSYVSLPEGYQRVFLEYKGWSISAGKPVPNRPPGVRWLPMRHFSLRCWWLSRDLEDGRREPVMITFTKYKEYPKHPKPISHRIHGAAIYANMTGVY